MDRMNDVERVDAALETYAAAMLGDLSDYRHTPAWDEARNAMSLALSASERPEVGGWVWCDAGRRPTVHGWESVGALGCDGPHRRLLVGPPATNPRR